MGAGCQAAHLSGLTRAFYERTAESFAATRQNPWYGWNELWRVVSPGLSVQLAEATRLRVVDVGCGNLRFERFLLQNTKAPLEVFAFDACEPLISEGLRAFSEESASGSVVHEEVDDIVAALADGRDFLVRAGECDLVVAFGFMHHVPQVKLRERLLRFMAAHTGPGGFLAVSFWQFGTDERLRKKAQEATARAQEAGVVGALAEGDYLLGWQDDASALRFCHHFTEDEIDGLASSIAEVAEEVGRFSADGKSGNLNRYVVWRRRG